MKRLLLLAMLLFSLTILIAQVTPDKYYHAGAGMIASAGMYTIGHYSNRDMNPVAPSLIAFTVGYSKEMYDTFATNNFSTKDLLWTTVSGIVTNTVLHFVWNKNKKKHKRSKELNFDELPLTRLTYETK